MLARLLETTSGRWINLSTGSDSKGRVITEFFSSKDKATIIVYSSPEEFLELLERHNLMWLVNSIKIVPV